MIDLKYFNMLSRKQRRVYLKNCIHELMHYTNEIVNFLLVNYAEVSIQHHKDLVIRLDTYSNEMMNIFKLYQEI